MGPALPIAICREIGDRDLVTKSRGISPALDAVTMAKSHPTINCRSPVPLRHSPPAARRGHNVENCLGPIRTDYLKKMPRRKLRNCAKCGVRHGPPIGKRCERSKEDLEGVNKEMERSESEGTARAVGEESGAESDTFVKIQIPAVPVYQPLGEDLHVPLFQSEKFGDAKPELGPSARPKKSFVNLQAQSAWESQQRPFTLRPQTGSSQPATTGSGASRQPATAAMAAQGASALPHQCTESMEYRLRKMELLVEQMVDVQRTQVLAEYHRSHSGADKKEKTEESSSSDDSESECGEWTEGDGRDLWKATKEKKKRNPFDHSSYTRKGEVVDSFEDLMVVTFKTMEELISMGKDVKGLVRHGLALSEKAATGIYKVEAFVKYDESVRERAGRRGPSTFGDVNQEDVMRHFCYDNAETNKPGKAQGKTSGRKRADKICLKYNGENGCNFKSCTFQHKCIACEEPGHPRKDCKALKRKETK